LYQKNRTYWILGTWVEGEIQEYQGEEVVERWTIT